MSRASHPLVVSPCVFLAIILGLGTLTCPGLVHAQDDRPAETADAEDVNKAPVDENVTQGALRIEQQDGSLVECPLKHTAVETEISGFIARVNVTQTFQNPTSEKIEAVYVFPLPHEAAVDSMTMQIGQRKIVGLIKRRDAARRVYEQALAQGQTAALLEQERPNIFTQSVGNIAPGQEVKIEISYIDVLKYDTGTYEFHFPMVVGPRFIPGTPIDSPQSPSTELRGKVSPPVSNTDRVSDATRISPPVLKPGYRNGHDIRLTIQLDAGVPVQALEVANHKVEIQRQGDRHATIQLASDDSIPNKDFVVRYNVIGERPELAVLGHTGKYTDTGRLGEGYFLLMMQPKQDEKLQQMPPREVVFSVDTSGSMSGEPTAKVRDAMQAMLELCRPQDTVQVITFASQAHKLFAAPVSVNEANVAKAINFSRNLRGSGGTHMLEGVKLAIDEPIDNERLRIVIMLTDGYIGNEAEIIKHVGENCGDQIRFWAIGIGSSPNMFLIEGVAKQGGGMGKRLGLQDDTAALTQNVMNRIQRAQLSKISIDWGGLDVAETYPARIPELWAGRPVMLFGRYSRGGSTEIRVRGLVEGKEVSWPLAVHLPEQQTQHDVLAKVWARKKIEGLMQQAFYQDAPAIEEEVTAMALDYGLMSQYTSFVAVDESQQPELTEPASRPRQMLVPVPLPAGTRYEGFFGAPYPRGEDEQLVTGLALYDSFGSAPSPAANRRAPGVLAANLSATTSNFSTRYSIEAQHLSRRRVLSLVNRPVVYANPVAGKSARLFFRNDDGLRATSSSRFARPRGAEMPGRGRATGGWAFGRGAGFGGGGGFGGRGGQAPDPSGHFFSGTRIMRLSESVDFDSVALEAVERESGYMSFALRDEASLTTKTAEAALKEATELEKKGDDVEARAKYLQACFLDQAAANVGASSGEVGHKALVAIERLRARDLDTWTKRMPTLANPLDLVLRDKSIPEALAEISAAAGVTITLTPGSVDDATSLLLETPRVQFLDLRRATLAESLDWTLQPARLTWQLVDGGIVATSERRREGKTAWVYDVSIAALPTQEELGSFKDHDKALKAAQSLADQLIRALRADLDVDEQSMVWFAPGQLLVFGDKQRHTDAAGLFATLTESDQTRVGKQGRIYAACQQRSKARVEKVRQQRRLTNQMRVVTAHDTFGWPLLAAAAGGRLDLEALTRLQIAWNREETDDLLDGRGTAAILKSLWIVNEASHALPNESELKTLASLARERSRPAADAALAALTKDPEDTRQFAATLFAALALRDDEAFLAKALPLLTQSRDDAAQVAQARVLAAALLGDEGPIDRPALERVISGNPAGDDLIVLTALAARRCGGDTWETFRAASHRLLAEQPLAGSVVVLVHRLAGAQLAVLIAR